METIPVKIHTASIELQAFLKWCGHTMRGGEAKVLVKDGQVYVNGELEPKRSRRLVIGDRVEVEGKAYLVIPEDAT